MRWRLWASRPPSVEIGDISLGDIDNPFRGASADAGSAAADAFRRPSRTIPLGPDLGLDGIAADALATANTYRQAATDLAHGATAPLTSWGPCVMLLRAPVKKALRP